jgi:hypothetical protein
MTVPDSNPAVRATPIAAPHVSKKGPGHTLSKRRTVTPSPRITRRSPIKDLTTATSPAAASAALGTGCPCVPMHSRDPSGPSCAELSHGDSDEEAVKARASMAKISQNGYRLCRLPYIRRRRPMVTSAK